MAAFQVISARACMALDLCRTFGGDTVRIIYGVTPPSHRAQIQSIFLVKLKWCTVVTSFSYSSNRRLHRRLIQMQAFLGKYIEYIELALLIAGLVALVVGYRKNRRNILLSAAIILFLAGTVGDFAHGFRDGFNAGWSSSAARKL